VSNIFILLCVLNLNCVLDLTVSDSNDSQLVGESEKMRMKKLEELSKNIDSIH